ncbi:MAG TPA: hypothetical protein VGC31_07780 [Paenirhodobacter sp.]
MNQITDATEDACAKALEIGIGALRVNDALSMLGDNGASVTTNTICRELRADLPTYPCEGTTKTLKSGARFVTTFNAICED